MRAVTMSATIEGMRDGHMMLRESSSTIRRTDVTHLIRLLNESSALVSFMPEDGAPVTIVAVVESVGRDGRVELRKLPSRSGWGKLAGRSTDWPSVQVLRRLMREQSLLVTIAKE